MLYSRGCMLEGFGWLYAPPRPQNLQHVKWYPFQEKIPHICSSSRELIKFGCSVLDKESQNPNAIGRCIGVLKKRTLPKAYFLFKHKQPGAGISWVSWTIEGANNSTLTVDITCSRHSDSELPHPLTVFHARILEQANLITEGELKIIKDCQGIRKRDQSALSYKYKHLQRKKTRVILKLIHTAELTAVPTIRVSPTDIWRWSPKSAFMPLTC